MIGQAIDIWYEELSAKADEYLFYWDLLDNSEQSKAMRFFQEKHRSYYVISHGKLRIILASYIGIAPEKLRFKVGKFGKPFIVDNGKPHKLKFNLSHSGNKMVAAVGYHGSIGVDIEVWNEKIDYYAIVEGCFAKIEATFWKALADSEKTAVFYRFWVRKESFAKAVGAGITLGISNVINSVDDPVRYLEIPDCYGKASDWKVIDLNLGSKITGALTMNFSGIEKINLKWL